MITAVICLRVHMLKLTRITKPDYATKAEVRLENIKQSTYQSIQHHRTEMLAVVDREVAAYVSDSGLVGNEDASFPSSSKMTGEYYIGDESYCAHVGPVWIQVGIQTRFLEKQWRDDQKDFDYLGLEVWIRCVPDDWSFTIFRNTDSSSI